MGVSKAFAEDEILTAQDVNEHLSNRQKIQSGTVQINMGGQASATAQVTFPEPFTGTGEVSVMATYGSSNSVPTLIPGAYGISNTGFTAMFVIGDRSTHTGTRTLNWLAVQDY